MLVSLVRLLTIALGMLVVSVGSCLHATLAFSSVGLLVVYAVGVHWSNVSSLSIEREYTVDNS